MAVGVFGLQVAYKLKRTELLSLEDTHGWFGGGFVPASSTTLSSVERIDFSNDTSTPTPRGALSVARRSLTAIGNSNFGWFGGGWFTPSTPQINYSTIDRINFYNDSVTTLARGPLASTRYNLGSTANSNYGWFGGGQLFDPVTPANTRKTSVDRIDFSNDSPTASPRGPLSLARSNLAATGNSNYGWFGGGYDPAFRSTVDRIDFANDSVIASVRGPLGSTSRNRFAAAGNSNYGWFGGGLGISAVDRINFSNDTAIVSVRGSLSSSRENPGATSGQAKSSSIRLQKAANFGWFGGGLVLATPAPLIRSTVDRIDFSNDSVTASPRGPLSLARWGSAATGNSNFGWFGSGTTPTPARVTTVDRINFSNDLATASPRGPLSLARYGLAATGNSNFGWFGGGNGSVPGAAPFVWVSNVNRIDFSNDSPTVSVRGPLSTARGLFAATSNSNYGWFGGGYGGGFIITVNRVNFANDLSTASPRSPLSNFRSDLAATGNSNYGWFGGGYFPSFVSTVDRITFANDSVSVSIRGSLAFTRHKLAATSNTPIG